MYDNNILYINIVTFVQITSSYMGEHRIAFLDSLSFLELFLRETVEMIYEDGKGFLFQF